MTVSIHHASCLDWLAEYDGPLFDSCVTDPPYHLTSIVKRFGGKNAAEAKVGATGAYARASKGFMGKEWDGGDIAFRPETWRAIYDVLKPGAHLVAFSGTRTYHRMACAIEDAGFEIRDQLGWAYGSGFPKSHDVSKGIDKAAGAEREKTPIIKQDSFSHVQQTARCGLCGKQRFSGNPCTCPKDSGPATPEAEQWQGWGTALKPSVEPVCFAQKPYTNSQQWVTVKSLLERLWSDLWLMLPAKIAEKHSALSPQGFGVEMSAFVQCNAGQKSNIRAGSFGRMDTSQFVSALISSLSTVLSWNVTLAEHCRAENTSTTGTESSTTIDLRTLKSCLSKITPESIIAAHKTGQWSNADACNAARHLNACAALLNATRELSAIENATDWEALNCPDVGELSTNLEPICLARKPLSEKSVAANVLKHGTGAINIDGCRVGTDESTARQSGINAGIYGADDRANIRGGNDLGRWPANLLHDGSDEVLAGFPETGAAKSSERGLQHSGRHGGLADIGGNIKEGTNSERGHDDNGGSAARFFYSAKAGPLDRIGTAHATVKPVDLMRWLVRMVTPPGGHILEPFAGSGTTGIAAMAEGFDCTMIELEAEHVADIERKLAFLRGEGALTFQEHNHAKLQRAKETPLGGLFGGAA